MDITTHRVALDTYHHAFRCECGWVSQGAPNGQGTAGAALVRHMLEHHKEDH